jgi:predicted nucleic acid-binding protein
MTDPPTRAAKILIDTNVLVYAYDLSEPLKQRQALKVLGELAALGRGAVTTQVLGEFFTVVTRKIPSALSAGEAVAQIRSHLSLWTVIELTGGLVLDAAIGVRDHKMSFWDAQIWAAARANRIPVVLSEDFSDSSVVDGVRFVNPFLPGFALERCLASPSLAKTSMAKLLRARLRPPASRRRGRQPAQDPILKVAGVCRGPILSSEIDDSLYGG